MKKNWVVLLLIAKFALNRKISNIIKVILFFTNFRKNFIYLENQKIIS